MGHLLSQKEVGTCSLSWNGNYWRSLGSLTWPSSNSGGWELHRNIVHLPSALKKHHTSAWIAPSHKHNYQQDWKLRWLPCVIPLKQSRRNTGCQTRANLRDALVSVLCFLDKEGCGESHVGNTTQVSWLFVQGPFLSEHLGHSGTWTNDCFCLSWLENS